MSARAGSAGRRGGPLAMLVLLLGGWSAARAVLWHDPFASAPVPEGPERLAGFAPAPFSPEPPILPPSIPMPLGVPQPLHADAVAGLAGLPGGGAALQAPARGRAALLGQGRAAAGWDSAELAAGHMWLRAAALGGAARGRGLGSYVLAPGESGAQPPFLPPAPPGAGSASGRSGAAPPGGRWSAQAWALWRQGSSAGAVSQGRVPIYGASQMGAIIDYRLARASARDPRLYARAYRALVRGGESELALGASARPLARVPLRLAGELRYTDGAERRSLRPAAYGVTELAPETLPLGTRLEAYAQGGWVGGRGSTPFADGQVTITREARALAGFTNDAARLSLGLGAWGGAQKDAQRLDLGPTMRLDVTLGQTPARLAFDWRARVAGEASPGSGLAATLSTSF
ncbi:hypothetical protein [Erythrobacter cryptus]|uniref:hypothetical protein n=1 Tax=Erythrobacter cryptus TaxID=196588 RepID=UPI000427B15A|nr:hypothetical protein [Erythrobacter cryptus]